MAKKFAKWIGGGLGWALGGPIGGIFGFALGAMFDNTVAVEAVEGEGMPGGKSNGAADDFLKAMLVLSAAVMKADGKVLKSELDYVKTYFVNQFGEEKTAHLLLILKEILKQDIPLQSVAEQVRYNMEYSSRLALLHFLFHISNADGQVDATEVNVIQQIAGYLNISVKDFESIKAMFWKDKEAAYRILEIESSCADDEVKKAYRKMALKYHPDKLTHLGEDIKKASSDRFLKVQEAYELIKKERGIN